MNVFRNDSLRRTKPDPLKVTKALEMAELKRQRAQALFENDFFEESIVSSYTSMFQAARALLFHDGVIEKSHACVVAYLREHYSSALGQDTINWLDTYRLERHESFYGLEKSNVDEHEAEDALEKSKKSF
ncbi:MAG: HEPN domain-containing protein [Thermoplasmata archaeon]|nr:HEPN domain-containing protein [Thermoplasmata archaeon]